MSRTDPTPPISPSEDREAVAASPVAERTRVRPYTDVYETQDTLILVADVPGADESSIQLELVDDVLELRAAPRTDSPDGWQPLGPELEVPAYERSFRLAADIERDSIGASLQNGRLRVVLKKRVPRSQRIDVRAG